MKYQIINIFRNQKGFTLIELIISVAISGFIIGGVTAAIIGIFVGHAQSSGEIEALRQVQNVGYWIARDGQMVMETRIMDDPDTDSGVDKLEIFYTEFVSWDEDGNLESVKHKITYNLSEDGTLMRYEFCTDTYAPHVPGLPSMDEFTNEVSSIRVADYISYFDYNQLSRTLTITATTGGFNSQTETRQYEVIPRPEDIFWL